VSTSPYINVAQRTFAIESKAIESTLRALDERAFALACDLMLARSGRVIVMGIGKSGHIARKIASTLTSTGTPALFLHPSEAAHGDIGFVSGDDTAIILSKSGESEELLPILPVLISKHVPIIAITSSQYSHLAQAAESSGGSLLLLSIPEEACPHDLAPTASTTAQLVLGDALAMALLDARNFSSNDFAKLHPGGSLGKRLTYTVKDLMASGKAIPSVNEEDTLATVLNEISGKRLGMTCVVTKTNVIRGVVTDGDIRRFFENKREVHLDLVKAKDLMSTSPKTTTADVLAAEAVHVMQDTLPKVMHLPVIDAERRVVGVIHLHEIVKAGIANV
jgi:arabinose-5-phosphate isomerase